MELRRRIRKFRRVNSLGGENLPLRMLNSLVHERGGGRASGAINIHESCALRSIKWHPNGPINFKRFPNL